MSLTVAHLSLPMVGELANGDRPVFHVDDEGRVMIGVIDGLGHGPEAAKVAEIAVDHVKAVSLQTPLYDLMTGLHDKLAGTRGAAATLCIVRAREIEVCAVGNVEVRCAESRIPLVFSNGILGGRVAKFHVCRTTLAPRSRLVLFSDGISSRTPVDEMRRMTPPVACDAIMQKYRRKEDDATILVADAE